MQYGAVGSRKSDPIPTPLQPRRLLMFVLQNPEERHRRFRLISPSSTTEQQQDERISAGTCRWMRVAAGYRRVHAEWSRTHATTDGRWCGSPGQTKPLEGTRESDTGGSCSRYAARPCPSFRPSTSRSFGRRVAALASQSINRKRRLATCQWRRFTHGERREYGPPAV